MLTSRLFAIPWSESVSFGYGNRRFEDATRGYGGFKDGSLVIGYS